MKSRILTCITAMTLFAALTLPVELIAQHTRYKVIDLGTLGGTVSLAEGMDNKGQVVGFRPCAETCKRAPFFGGVA